MSRSLAYYTKLFLVFLALSLVGWGVIEAPGLHVVSINISGTNTLTRREVLQQLGEVEGWHFTRLWVQNPALRLVLHPKIKEASLSLEFPSTLNIAIQERTPLALIPYYNAFLCIDVEGKVIDLVATPRWSEGPLPLLTGLVLPLVTVGEFLPMNPCLVAGIRVLSQLGAEHRIQFAEVDITSPFRVILRSSDNIIIDVGEGYDLYLKSNYLLEVLAYVRSANLTGGKILVGQDTITYQGALPTSDLPSEPE
ncbi:MAG: FtsQ-type POTRA domain-containing protein [Symbiobacteriaceae bacterium]|nr:FtsQ-type POTRA domain-containing protein [Symbiobacteriaceae bacterium]